MADERKVREVTYEERREAYLEVFSGEAGQIVLADLLQQFGFRLNSTFDPNPHVTSFREGQRSVVSHIGKRMEFTQDTEKQYANL